MAEKTKKKISELNEEERGELARKRLYFFFLFVGAIIFCLSIVCWVMLCF